MEINTTELEKLQTGSDNVVLGTTALNHVVTGKDNVCLGPTKELQAQWDEAMKHRTNGWISKPKDK